jgi:parallel beta-helix repeat protein
MRYRYILLGAIAAVICLAFASGASASTGACELYASPSGSDVAPGTLAAPVQTVSRLARILRPGQVGCLRAGSYQGEGGSYKELKISTPGVTIAAAPGEVAEIDARIWIAQGADGVSFERLKLEGANSKNLPSPTVNANDATFREDEVTNGHTTICFDLGNTVFGKAVGTTIEDSVVHACGELPSTNMEHGIYLSDAEDTVIRRNWIYDNVDRGIQLYPDAQNTLITENVIYGNGEGIIFSGNEEVAASGTVVTHNLIADSQIRRNVESFYPEGAPHGVENVVSENCISGASTSYYAGRNGSGIQEPEVGFSASNNVTATPQFSNLAAGDLQVVASVACTAMLGVTAALQPGPPGVGTVAPTLPIAPPVVISTPSEEIVSTPSTSTAPTPVTTAAPAHATTVSAPAATTATAAKEEPVRTSATGSTGASLAGATVAPRRKPAKQARRAHRKAAVKRLTGGKRRQVRAARARRARAAARGVGR